MVDPSRIIVALDVDSFKQATPIAESLAGTGVTYKIGNQLATTEGWKACIEFARAHQARIFCDSKFKDIPETVKLSSRSMTHLQPDMFNIMADTDPEVLTAAIDGIHEAAEEFGVVKPIVLGVTVLTSMSDEVANSIYGASSADKVLQFATAAANAGLDGVVCSAEEAKALRGNPDTSKLTLVTPGIRPSWAVSGDQSRIMTPKMAIEAGADYLVIGRPITQPPPEVGLPKNAFEKIMEELI